MGIDVCGMIEFKCNNETGIDCCGKSSAKVQESSLSEAELRGRIFSSIEVRKDDPKGCKREGFATTESNLSFKIALKNRAEHSTPVRAMSKDNFGRAGSYVTFSINRSPRCEQRYPNDEEVPLAAVRRSWAAANPAFSWWLSWRSFIYLR